MFKLVFTESYEKKAKKFLKQHPELKKQYTKTLKLLQLNPQHPSLRLHKLQGLLSSLHAVSINYTYRITILFIIAGKEIVPINVGKHDEVY